MICAGIVEGGKGTCWVSDFCLCTTLSCSIQFLAYVGCGELILNRLSSLVPLKFVCYQFNRKMEVGLCCVNRNHWTNGWCMASWAGAGSARRSEVQRCTPAYLSTETGLTIWCLTVRICFHFIEFFYTTDHIEQTSEKIWYNSTSHLFQCLLWLILKLVSTNCYIYVTRKM